MPWSEETGAPFHFHSSTISGSASRMILRRLASVLPRQSVSPAINSSICSLAFIALPPERLKFLPHRYRSLPAPSARTPAAVEQERRVRRSSGLSFDGGYAGG